MNRPKCGGKIIKIWYHLTFSLDSLRLLRKFQTTDAFRLKSIPLFFHMRRAVSNKKIWLMLDFFLSPLDKPLSSFFLLQTHNLLTLTWAEAETFGRKIGVKKIENMVRWRSRIFSPMPSRLQLFYCIWWFFIRRS